MISSQLCQPICEDFSLNDQNQYVKISQIDLATPNILNEKLSKACKVGFFYLEIPEDCKTLIDHAVKLGNTFYQKEEYKSLQLDGVRGYRDHQEFQVESLCLERAHWSENLSFELKELAIKMEKIAVDLLKNTHDKKGDSPLYRPVDPARSADDTGSIAESLVLESYR